MVAGGGLARSLHQCCLVGSRGEPVDQSRWDWCLRGKEQSWNVWLYQPQCCACRHYRKTHTHTHNTCGHTTHTVMYTRTHIHTQTHNTHRHTRTHRHTTRTRTHTGTYTHTHRHTQTHMHTQTHYTHTHAHRDVHTHTHFEATVLLQMCT